MEFFYAYSLTASHTNVGGNGIKQFLKEIIKGDDSYPWVLQDLLADGYDVVNFGLVQCLLHRTERGIP